MERVWSAGRPLLVREIQQALQPERAYTTVWTVTETLYRKGWLPRQDVPDLPLVLPLRLAGTAGRLAAAARSLAGTGSGGVSGQAALLTGQLSALSAEAAAARAITCGPGRPGVGDALLWESLSAAVGRAAVRLPVTSRSPA